jgi:hypothetical protein
MVRTPIITSFIRHPNSQTSRNKPRLNNPIMAQLHLPLPILHLGLMDLHNIKSSLLQNPFKLLLPPFLRREHAHHKHILRDKASESHGLRASGVIWVALEALVDQQPRVRVH